MSETASRSPARAPSETLWAVLGGTRFFLAAIVANAHYGMTLKVGEPPPLFYFAGRQLGPLAAIIGFLLISGFSIAHSVEQPRRFYQRRLARIYPVLAVVALVQGLALTLAGPVTTPDGQVFPAPIFAQWLTTLALANAFIGGSFVIVAWSLSAEAAYYIAAPMLRRIGTLTVLCAAALSAALHFFNEALGIGRFPGVIHGLAALSLFWAWGAGFLLFRHFGQKTWLAIATAIVGVVLILRFNYEGGRLAPLTYLLALGAIVFGDRRELPDVWRKALAYLGDISYPLFLIHFPVIVIGAGVFGVTSYVVLMAVALALSAACLHAVDRPMRRWIGRLRLGARRHGAAPQES